MNLLIFGATGATGQHLVRLALSQGHQVTAFVRDPGRLIDTSSSLAYVIGDVMQLPSLESALRGQDAVLCALGTMPESKADRPRRQPSIPVCSVGTQNILQAMSNNNCRRIVAETSTSVGESRYTSSLGAAAIIRTILKDVMEDKERQETAIRASNTDWTIVRPVRLTNGAAQNKIQVGEKLPWSMLSTISRADVAAFMIAALSDPLTSYKALTIKS